MTRFNKTIFSTLLAFLLSLTPWPSFAAETARAPEQATNDGNTAQVDEENNVVYPELNIIVDRSYAIHEFNSGNDLAQALKSGFVR